MKIATESESIEWLSSRGLTDGKGHCLPDRFPRKARYKETPDSGRKTALAGSLAVHFCKFDEAMLWIDEYGIWTSSENLPLFDGYHSSLGESRPVWEAPGHIFTPSDEDVVWSLLSMTLYFVWGAVLASPSGELMMRISHDEIIDVYARDGLEVADQVFELMKHYID